MSPAAREDWQWPDPRPECRFLRAAGCARLDDALQIYHCEASLIPFRFRPVLDGLEVVAKCR
jgi:hypothetical protein